VGGQSGGGEGKKQTQLSLFQDISYKSSESISRIREIMSMMMVIIIFQDISYKYNQNQDNSDEAPEISSESRE